MEKRWERFCVFIDCKFQTNCLSTKRGIFQVTIERVAKNISPCERLEIEPVSTDDWEIIVSVLFMFLTGTILYEYDTGMYFRKDGVFFLFPQKGDTLAKSHGFAYISAKSMFSTR